ncbi:MAG TPA: hypothetical protein VF898_14230 [Chloroflexota bacterium]
MRTPRFVVVAVLTLVTMLSYRSAHASPQAAFQECGYKVWASKLAQQTSSLISASGKLSSATVHQEASGYLQQLDKMNMAYENWTNSHSRVASAALRKALGYAEQAADGHELGIAAIYNQSVQNAWAQMKTAWIALTPLCPLGHPTSVQEQVTTDGTDYPNGVGAFPVSQPWLSVPKEWEVQWSYNCTHRSFGFRVEVRNIPSNQTLASNGTSVYLGPLLATPINQHNRTAHGTQLIKGMRGSVYLVVHSVCTYSLEVIG